MKVIQIVGPSYCGSTALGYSLNTIDGFFFGSEVRRLLRSNSDHSNPLFCDFCGESCTYWSKSFMSTINKNSTLNDVYKYFSNHHPHVRYFVDSSKLLSSYTGTNASYIVVCAKHPIRMIASHLYNLRAFFEINSENLNEFKKELLTSKNSIDNIKHIINNLHKTYTEIFNKNKNFFYFKTDMAHTNNMDMFFRLLNYFNLNNTDIDIKNFSTYPCHSLGGNRAPVHLMKKRNKIPDVENHRFKYYEKFNFFGNWKIDNKYKEILPSTLIQEILKMESYRNLSYLLGYEHSLTSYK